MGWNAAMRFLLLSIGVLTLTAASPLQGEWVEQWAERAPMCSTSALAARQGSANAAFDTSANAKCTVKDLCLVMQQLDENFYDKSVPNARYYSAYKCKTAVMKDRGSHCTANSPGKIGELYQKGLSKSACAKAIVRFRGTEDHGKLFHWITTVAGPSIWKMSNEARGVFCQMRNRRGDTKLALVHCNALANKDDAFKPTGSKNTYNPFSRGRRRSQHRRSVPVSKSPPTCSTSALAARQTAANAAYDTSANAKCTVKDLCLVMQQLDE